jgi:hypothetical protein
MHLKTHRTREVKIHLHGTGFALGPSLPKLGSPGDNAQSVPSKFKSWKSSLLSAMELRDL